MRKYNINVKAALAVFAIVLSACSSDNDIVDNNSTNQEKTDANKSMTFHASMDGITTRTDFNSNNTVWAQGDKISILNTASVPKESKRDSQADFTISKGVGTKEATFTGGPIRANMDGTSDKFYAFYPAQTLTNTNGTVTASGNIPTVQTATDGTYNQSLHFMSAYSTNATFNFKNVCSLIKITLTNNTSICRVKVVANPTLTNVNDQQFNYTSITGNFDATIGSDGIASVTATDAKSTYVELRAKGDDGTAKTVIGNGTFYMVVLPATISNGFTLLLEKTNGTIYQRISTKVTEFERNKMYDLGSFDCSGTPNGMTELTNVVDLDLPSGTIWATKNLTTTRTGTLLGGYTYTHDFAASETEYGDYFSFGEHYVQATTADTPNSYMTNYTLKTQYDMAYSFDNRYCMPIYAQLYEFYNNFSNDNKDSFKGNSNPDKGAKFWTSTGRYIWLPYGGHYWASIHQNRGTKAAYWSRTYVGNVSSSTLSGDAYCLDLKESNKEPILDQHNGFLDGATQWHDNSYSGRNIRPVVTNVQIAPIY